MEKAQVSWEMAFLYVEYAMSLLIEPCHLVVLGI